MNIISLIKPKTDSASPGQLAAELDDARARFEETRQSVIGRGVERVRQIDALKAELEAEQEAHRDVLEQARP